MVFKPRGEVAQWRLVYEELAKRDVGDVVGYDVLAEVLDMDARLDRPRIALAMRTAAQAFLEDSNIAVTSVRGVGYRLVEAVEHLALARKHHTKAVKSLGRGQSKVVHVDMSGLEPAVRHTFEVMARAFSVQLDFNRRFEAKQEQMEQTLESVEKTSTRSEQEIADLRARLERLETSGEVAE